MLTAFSFAPHDFWKDVLQNHAGLTVAGTGDAPSQYPGMYQSSSCSGQKDRLHRKVLDYLLPFLPQQGKIFNPGPAITHPATKPLTSMPQITEFRAPPWYTLDGRTTSFLEYTCIQANNKNLQAGASPTSKFAYKTTSTLQNPRNQSNKQVSQGRNKGEINSRSLK